jgi:GTP cyclohydrolase-4
MNRIGLLGLEKLVEVQRPFGTVVLLPKIDVFLEIHEKSHGFDLDEIVNKVIDEALKKKVTGIGRLCTQIAKKLLEENSHVKKTEVKMEADYAVYRKTPVSKLKTQEMFKVISAAISEVKKGVIITKKMLGVEVTGTTSCPCAQEGLIEYSRDELKKTFSENDVDKILKTVPVASHNQRNISQLLIEIPEDWSIEIEDLIAILENAMSSMMYEVLKRQDEASVVLQSHKNPKFVEDVVREILINTMQRYKNLPGDSTVFVRSETYESIHQHNAIAERITTLKELREEFLGNPL